MFGGNRVFLSQIVIHNLGTTMTIARLSPVIFRCPKFMISRRTSEKLLLSFNRQGARKLGFIRLNWKSKHLIPIKVYLFEICSPKNYSTSLPASLANNAQRTSLNFKLCTSKETHTIRQFLFGTGNFFSPR